VVSQGLHIEFVLVVKFLELVRICQVRIVYKESLLLFDWYSLEHGPGLLEQMLNFIRHSRQKNQKINYKLWDAELPLDGLELVQGKKICDLALSLFHVRSDELLKNWIFEDCGLEIAWVVPAQDRLKLLEILNLPVLFRN